VDMVPTVDPKSGTPLGAGETRKVWTAPRLTVHGALPAMTLAPSVVTKTPP
jgi:hypothetical protein